MTIQERITEIEALSDYLIHVCDVEKIAVNSSIVVIDFWLKRTQGSVKKAQLNTERYVVIGYDTENEEAWIDDTNIVQMVRTKKW